MLSTKINNVDNTGTYTLIKDRAHAALDKHTTIHRLTPTHPYLPSPMPAQSHHSIHVHIHTNLLPHSKTHTRV